MTDFPTKIFFESSRAFRLLFMRPDKNGNMSARENLLYCRELDIIYNIFSLSTGEDFPEQNLEKCCDLWNCLADNSLKKEIFSIENILLQSAFELIISADPENLADGEESIFVREKLQIILQGAACWKMIDDALPLLTRRAILMLQNVRQFSDDELKNKLVQCDPFRQW